MDEHARISTFENSKNWKRGVGVAVVGVGSVFFAIALGTSLVALLPVAFAILVIGVIFTAWRHRAARTGGEIAPRKLGSAQLVGGAASKRADAIARS